MPLKIKWVGKKSQSLLKKLQMIFTSIFMTKKRINKNLTLKIKEEVTVCSPVDLTIEKLDFGASVLHLVFEH